MLSTYRFKVLSDFCREVLQKWLDKIRKPRQATVPHENILNTNKKNAQGQTEKQAVNLKSIQKIIQTRPLK